MQKKPEDNFSWTKVSKKVALHRFSVPEFLQLAPCVHADDLAVAAPSFRSLMTAVSPAFVVVDSVAGLNLNHPKCYSVQHGSSEIKIVKHAKNGGTMIGPGGHLHRWTAAREKFTQRARKINETSKNLVERLVDFKMFALSVPEYFGS